LPLTSGLCSLPFDELKGPPQPGHLVKRGTVTAPHSVHLAAWPMGVSSLLGRSVVGEAVGAATTGRHVVPDAAGRAVTSTPMQGDEQGLFLGQFQFSGVEGE
jgi:hypothetical protein